MIQNFCRGGKTSTVKGIIVMQMPPEIDVELYLA